LSYLGNKALTIALTAGYVKTFLVKEGIFPG